MFFNADDDEQDFVSTGGGSKLANLFGMDKASGQGGNSSLTYTAPKEPKKKEPAPQGNAPAVVVAGVVQAYKYVDNKYASQGKLGAALLANHQAKDYRILLYVSKQQQVTNAKITAAFAFNVQENNYASFYDDARQTWSVMFDTTENAQKFAKEIALAKANSVGDALTDVMKQDLALGDGGPLENGDSVEVKYSGWLLTNNALSPTPFDSNTASDKLFRFKVGKGKVIKGWDQGMLGLKKGSKRMLVIPPSLGYGAQGVANRIPANATLVFEVEVVRVKLAKGDSALEPPVSTPIPTPAPTQAHVAEAGPPEHDEMDEVGIKGRTKSINEQMGQSPNSDKAKLISRMARMGKPMLPFQGAVPAQPEEDEADHNSNVQTLAKRRTALFQRRPMIYHTDKSHDLQAQPQHEQHVHPQVMPRKPSLSSKPTVVQSTVYAQQQGMGQPAVAMVGNQPVVVGETVVAPAQPGQLPFQQQQQQPAFLQNLPGAQQLSVYQNPNILLQQQQQQQAALLQQQQQAQMMGMTQPLGAQPPLYAGAPHVSVAPITPAVPTSSADSLAPVLLTETRQQNTEVRLSISKMSEKVDKILEKVTMNPAMMGPGMSGMGAMSPYMGGMSAPTMEANVLMQNITRIVQDNERLKKEVYDQSSKVQEQNEKINTLLEKNQKYVEQSQNLLEQRNDGYKSSANQSQARVLNLEQEKVSLATELSTASAQITTLQLELADTRKREGELKQKLQMTSSTGTETKEELSRLKLLKEDNEQKIETLSTTVREEKLARKQLESKLSIHMEEFNDIKSTNDTLEKNLTDRKKKAAEERRKLEEDMEDAKINYETTIEGLRERLRRQKTSTDAETESKMSKIEEEISNNWQQKSERMLASATEKHNRQLEDIKEEKEELVRKVAELEKKVISVRSSESSTEQQVNELKDELDEMKAWKGKYDNLRKQAASMKEKYEKRIEELEAEKGDEEEKATDTEERYENLRKTASSMKEKYEKRIEELEAEKEDEEEKTREMEEKAQEQKQQYLQQIQQLRSQQTTSSGPVQNSAPSADATTEVKKVMNQVFQSLRGEFEADEMYQGNQVLATMLNIIKQKTLEMVKNASSKNEEEEEDEEEGEEEEEEEEEDEGDEEVKDIGDQNGPSRADVTKKEEMQTVEDQKPDKKTDAEAIPPEDVDKQSEVKVPESSSQVPSSHIPLASSSPSSPASSSISSSPHKEDASKPPLQETEIQPVIDTQMSKEPPAEEDISNNNKNTEDEMSETESSTDIDKKDSTVDDIVDGEIQPVPVVIDNDTPSIAKQSAIEPEKETEKPPVSINGTNENSDDKTISKEKDESKSESPAVTDIPKGSPTKTNVSPPATDTTSREPPPLFDDDEEDEDGESPLFGKDSNVSDTFGPAFESKSRSQSTLSNNKANLAAAATATTPAKKVDLGLDEDNKPQPPPPLFGDDSDDDDLDWLS